GEQASDSSSEWDLYVAAGGQERMRVAFPAGQAEYQYPAGHQEVAVERTRDGNTMIARRALCPVIEEHSWGDDGRLTLRGIYPASVEGSFETVLRRRSSTQQHVLAFDREGDTFTIVVDAGRMPSFGRQLPLRDGTWDILVRRAGGGDGRLIVPRYDHARLADVDGRKVTFGLKVYKFNTAGYDTPLLAVGPALKLTEHGRV